MNTPNSINADSDESPTGAPSETGSGNLSDSAEYDGMPFLEHLEELRGALLRCMISLIVGCALAGAFMQIFADALSWPLRFAFGDSATRGLVTNSPMGVFSVILQVCFFGGLGLSLPFMMYFMARFVSPGLTFKEKAALAPCCVVALLLFLSGAAFGYFALVPASLKASLYFNELFGFEVLWSADRYYGMLVWMVMGIGLTFEFPLVIVFLVYIGVLNSAKLIAFRSYSIVVFMVVAAVITPTTDPFTFLLLAMPMSALYEISLRVAVWLERGQQEPNIL